MSIELGGAKAVTVTGTASEELVKNVNRKHLTVQNNDSDFIVVNYGGVATLTTGIHIAAGLADRYYGEDVPIDAVSIISNSGSAPVSILEG